MGREIGKIVEVRGVSVKAELLELLPPYLMLGEKVIAAPRINTYVKTRVGLDTVICQITGEYNDEKTKGNFSGYYLDLTVKGHIEGGRFIQGLRLLPIVAASVELLDFTDLEKIYDYDVNSSFIIGRNLFDLDRDIYLNYNDIIPSHIGIFGNTGSGKSNTLTKLLHSYAQILKEHDNGKLLIFDINNEYGNDAIYDRNEKSLYKMSTRVETGDKVPMDLNELEEDEWCILLNATEATQKPVIKSAFKDNKSEDEYLDIIKRILKDGQEALFRAIRFQMDDFIEGLEPLAWHSIYSKFYYKEENGNWVFSDQDGFDEKLNNIRVTIPDNGIKKFLFKIYMAAALHIGYGTQYDFISPMLRRAEKLAKDFDKVFSYDVNDVFADKNIVVIQLANVNNDMKQLIPSIISNHCFKKQVVEKDNSDIKSVLNIVIDEAHNLLYQDNEDYKHTSVTLETFEKIVKEGRKYGTFLWIASQRPSDISGTIISQMHNYFIHKLVNPYDLNKIRKAVAFLDEEAMNTMTVLGPGECILSGSAIAMPLFIKVTQVETKNRPNSENVVLFGEHGIFSKG